MSAAWAACSILRREALRCAAQRRRVVIACVLLLLFHMRYHTTPAHLLTPVPLHLYTTPHLENKTLTYSIADCDV